MRLWHNNPMSRPEAPLLDETVATPIPPRLHLSYLDGVRGLAALYIVAHHAYMEGRGDEKGLSPWIDLATQWLYPGPSAVGVFIVLSGFCLMLPVVRSTDGRLPGGLRDFLRRRARRILPPYYAAMALSLLLIAFVPDLGCMMPNSRWNNSLPAFQPGVLLSHLFLLHNLNADWLWKIDYPMWSVSTEWEIYFVFGLVLLPLWKRFGFWGVLLVTFVLAKLLDPTFHYAAFVYLFLFALGMTGAEIGFPKGSASERRLSSVPWGGLAAGLGALFALTFPFCASNAFSQAIFLSDDLVGLATMCLLVYGAREIQEGHACAPVMRILQSRPIVMLGTFSYSLYLCHAPLLALLNIARRHAHLSNGEAIALLLGLGLPLCLFASYIFYLAFERPFLRSARLAPQPLTPAAGPTPAPPV